MAKEHYSNAAIGFLSSAVSDSATSIPLTSSTMFPSSGNFTVKCDNEIMLVTANASNTLTVTRAQEGTTATTHAIGATIFAALTDGSLRRLVRASHEGTLVGARRELNFIDGGGVAWTLTDDPTNDKVDVEAVASGGGGSSFPFQADLVAPVNGDFTWLNQGTATVTTATGSIFLRALAASGNSVKGREVTPPSTPWNVIAKFQPFQVGSDYAAFGVYFRESSSGKITTLQFSSRNIYFNKYSDATTYSAAYANFPTDASTNFSWVKIADNGTNRILSLSADGTNWIVVHSIGRTDYLTADRVGWFAEANNAVYDVGVKLLSWQVNNS